MSQIFLQLAERLATLQQVSPPPDLGGVAGRYVCIVTGGGFYRVAIQYGDALRELPKPLQARPRRLAAALAILAQAS